MIPKMTPTRPNKPYLAMSARHRRLSQEPSSSSTAWIARTPIVDDSRRLPPTRCPSRTSIWITKSVSIRRYRECCQGSPELTEAIPSQITRMMTASMAASITNLRLTVRLSSVTAPSHPAALATKRSRPRRKAAIFVRDN